MGSHEVCGKLIVATNPEEIARLDVLFAQGEANGLEGLRLLERAAMLEIEPHVGGVRALLVPSTGITDYVGGDGEVCGDRGGAGGGS
jgi:(S)-2-hydroxyglutarate dehydrogenase